MTHLSKSISCSSAGFHCGDKHRRAYLHHRTLLWLQHLVSHAVKSAYGRQRDPPFPYTTQTRAGSACATEQGQRQSQESKWLQWGTEPLFGKKMQNLAGTARGSCDSRKLIQLGFNHLYLSSGAGQPLDIQREIVF